MSNLKKIEFQISEKSDELKKLIAEHPDYDICVLVGEDAHGGGDYYWMYATDIKFSVKEILSVETPYNDEVCTDRDTFNERTEEWLWEEMGEPEFSESEEAEFQAKLKDKIAEYDPYWKNVICIWADN